MSQAQAQLAQQRPFRFGSLKIISPGFCEVEMGVASSSGRGRARDLRFAAQGGAAGGTQTLILTVEEVRQAGAPG
jgi:hypothetical protein